MLADLVPCISIVSVLLVIFGFIAFLRYLNYRETIALAEKGLARPEASPMGANLDYIASGVSSYRAAFTLLSAVSFIRLTPSPK